VVFSCSGGCTRLLLLPSLLFSFGEHLPRTFSFSLSLLLVLALIPCNKSFMIYVDSFVSGFVSPFPLFFLVLALGYFLTGWVSSYRYNAFERDNFMLGFGCYWGSFFLVFIIDSFFFSFAFVFNCFLMSGFTEDNCWLLSFNFSTKLLSFWNLLPFCPSACPSVVSLKLLKKEKGKKENHISVSADSTPRPPLHWLRKR